MRISTLLFLILLIQPCFADTIYFNDGRRFDNVEIKETVEGIWVGGILFEKSKIARVEKKEVVKTASYPPRESWLDKLRAMFKKKEENPVSNIDERIKSRAQVEKEKAQRINQEVKKKAQKIKLKEERAKQQWESEPSTFSLPGSDNNRMPDIKPDYHRRSSSSSTNSKPRNPSVADVINEDTGERMTTEEFNRRHPE